MPNLSSAARAYDDPPHSDAVDLGALNSNPASDSHPELGDTHIDLPVIDPAAPVLSGAMEEAYVTFHSKVPRYWKVVMGRILREVNDGRQDVIALLRAQLGTPVTETLPKDVLAAMENRHLSSTNILAGTKLHRMLHIPPVPDARIQPDVRTSRSLSEAERKLVIQRNAMARDIKLLALGAELSGHPPLTQTDNGEQMTPGGVRFFVEKDAGVSPDVLLNPANWQGKRQIKDRVYMVTIDGKPYILKERKTARHKDTPRGGYAPTITSRQEFQTARALHERGNLDEGGMHVRWERPIGYAEFLDGFQFALFVCEEERPSTVDTRMFSDAVRKHPERFRHEYDAVQGRARRLLKKRDPRIPAFMEPQMPQGLFARALDLLKRKPLVSFERFADLKARFLEDRTYTLLQKARWKAGFISQDGETGFVHQQPDDTDMNIVGFDAENVVPRSTREAVGAYFGGTQIAGEIDTAVECAIWLAMEDAALEKDLQDLRESDTRDTA